MAKLRDYKSRWQGPEGSRLVCEVWKRLAAGESLRSLGLGEYEGRIDLRGISVPKVSKEELPPFRSWTLHRLKDFQQLKNACWEGLDFSDSDLEYIHFFHSRISDCTFDRVNCKEWRVRASDITRTSFTRCNLRNAALGTWYEGRGNRYEFVDFSRADMRGLLSSTATYVDCNFSCAKLDKVDFQSSGFIRCKFAGEVREVIFYSLAYESLKREPNRMEDVDFSNAQLRWCGFRKLNLNRLLLPTDQHHFIFRNYRCVLEKSLRELAYLDTRVGRGLKALLENHLRWIGPQQNIGILNKLDFLEAWGSDGQRFAVDLLSRVDQSCSRIAVN